MISENLDNFYLHEQTSNVFSYAYTFKIYTLAIYILASVLTQYI